jgi:hypothetical protein
MSRLADVYYVWSCHWPLNHRTNVTALCRANVSWDHVKSTLGLSPHGDSEETVFKLPLERIRVTSADNFWSSVNASVMMGRPLAAQAANLRCLGTGECTKDELASHHLATDLSGTVVMLPRVASKVGAHLVSQNRVGECNAAQLEFLDVI